jgi:hypothetical protein
MLPRGMIRIETNVDIKASRKSTSDSNLHETTLIFCSNLHLTRQDDNANEQIYETTSKNSSNKISLQNPGKNLLRKKNRKSAQERLRKEANNEPDGEEIYPDGARRLVAPSQEIELSTMTFQQGGNGGSLEVADEEPSIELNPTETNRCPGKNEENQRPVETTNETVLMNPETAGVRSPGITVIQEASFRDCEVHNGQTRNHNLTEDMAQEVHDSGAAQAELLNERSIDRPLRRTDGRISKRRSPQTRHQTPTMSKAIGILQWTWEQEKLALEAQKAADVESFRQLALNSECAAAASVREVEMLRKETEGFQSELNEKSTKLDRICKEFGRIRLFTQGLGNDLSRDKGQFECIKEGIRSLKDDGEALRSDCKSLEYDTTKGRDTIKELQDKFFTLVREEEAKERELILENNSLRARLAEQEFLLTKEKDINSSLQEDTLRQEQMKNDIALLLNTNRDHVFERLSQVLSQRDQVSRDNTDVNELRSLLEEIVSRKPATNNEMEALGSTLDYLEKKYVINLEMYMALTCIS